MLGKLSTLIGGVFAVHKIVQFGVESSRAARTLSDALTGLQSIVTGQGRSFAKAKGFIQSYTKDGLVPAANAITAYKNLAARGYDDSQIEAVLTALKDSAAFGRQASYSLGGAVETATEGLKNENSILVDNAGVTKNVAKMWDDYARSIGTTANRLTQQQKIQAEVSGILEETKFQTGDAARVAGTFSGQLMQLSFHFTNLKVAIGGIINPIANALLPIINTVIAALTRLANAAAAVFGAIFGRAKVQTSALAASNEQVASGAGAGAAAEKQLADNTKKAGKAAKGALAAFDDLNVLQQDMGGGAASAPSAGGTAAGGSVPIAAELEVEDTLSPQMQAVVDKIHELIKPLREIDFSPLIDAFGRLREAAAPLTKALFAGLEWAYYNLFVPLAQWTIEDVLPAFLDVLSGALRVVTSVLEALAPLGAWLWDSFLQPIAQWTGGVIVDVLHLIADGLTGISDWIRENQSLVRGLAAIFGALSGAWLAINGAFRLWNGLVGVWNTISAFAANGVKLFGKALTFLAANPIVLVITAITGLVLLIAAKGEEIKALILQLDGWLQSIFVQDWTNVFGPVLGSILNGFFHNLQNIWNGIKRILTGVIDFIRGVFTGDWQRAWQGVRDIFGSVFDSLGSLVKAPINGIIAALNAMIGGLNLLISGLNKIHIDIPDWVPALGGKSFGINIPSVPSIPLLAKGAVLPPNKPFLSVVGDQKHGTNIEAPLDTIKQALAEVLAQTPQGERETVIRFAASGGLEQLVRLLRPYIDREQSRVGTRLITGGA